MGNWVTKARLREEHPIYKLQHPFENLDSRERSSQDRPGHYGMRLVDDVVIGYWLGYVISFSLRSAQFLLLLPMRAPAFLSRPQLFRRAVRQLYWYRMRESAPMLGAVFALWGFIFTGVECVMELLRNKDDLLNIMVSAACGGAFLGGRTRGGARSHDPAALKARRVQQVQSMIFITLLITLFEGFGWYMSKSMGSFTWWMDNDVQSCLLGVDGEAGHDVLILSQDRREEKAGYLRALVRTALARKVPEQSAALS